MPDYYSEVEKIADESRNEGRAYEIINMCLEEGYIDDEIITKLQKRLEIGLMQAQEYLNMYYDGEL